MNRAVFLDRDGVINRAVPEGEYISSRGQMILLPAVTEAARMLHDAGFLIFIATNQRGVARQRVSVEELARIHSDILRHFSSAGAPITKIYFCPHEGGCGCRKPAPGMLLLAAREHAIDLKESWMVGDSTSDVEAGKRAGCRTVRIVGKREEPADEGDPDIQARDLPDAVDLILQAIV